MLCLSIALVALLFDSLGFYQETVVQNSSLCIVISDLNSVDSKQIANQKNGWKSLDDWIEELKNKNPITRSRAAWNLGNIGKPAVPALIKLFRSTNKDERLAAAFALACVGANAKAAVPELTRALKDNDPEITIAAARTLGHIGKAAKAAIPALRVLVQAKNNRVELEVNLALWRIVKEPKAIAPIIRNLNNKNQDVRYEAAHALGQIGAPAKAGIPALIQCTQDHYYMVRRESVRALGEIGLATGEVVAALRAALKDSQSQVPALTVLKKFGAASKPAIPELIQHLKNEHYLVRGLCAEILGEVGPDASEAVSALINNLNDKTIYGRRSAADALGKIGLKARAAIRHLKLLQNDQSAEVRRAANLALKKIQHHKL